MPLLQLIYTSRPFGFDATTLASILLTARHYNPLNTITGALVFRDDLYLQLLEGPDAAVRHTYERILRDPRHVDVTLIAETQVSERMFAEWDMKDDPADTWLWSREEVDQGAAMKATRDQALAIFMRISAASATSTA